MFLFLVIAIILATAVGVAVVFAGIFGGIFFIVFGDLIVCCLLMWLIYRLATRKRRN